MQQLFAPSVWERRLAVFFLCILFFLSQSVPTVFAFASGDENSWARVCTGAGIQIVQLDEEGREIPASAQADCTCCLPSRYDALLEPPAKPALKDPRAEAPISYFAAAPLTGACLFAHAICCRGPPPQVDATRLSQYQACSDPPDVRFGFANSVLVRVWV